MFAIVARGTWARFCHCYSYIMKKYELYWLAGVLEGEAYFSTNLDTASGKRYFQVQLVGWDLDILERVQEIFDGHISGPHKTRSPKHAPMYRMNFNGQRGRELMEMILPLMSERRTEQIEKALAEGQ